MSQSLHSVALIFGFLIGACSATPAPTPREDLTATPATGAPERAALASTAAPTAAPTAPTAAPAPTATASAVATATATPASNSTTKKDENALVMEPVFAMRGGGAVPTDLAKALRAAFDERIATSSKMAPSGATVAKPRNVVVTFLVEAPKGDEKALTVRMGLTGVESLGKCPVFDVDQKFTINGAKDLAKEGLELQKMAIAALLEKLEQSSGTLKPKANCTATR